MFLDNSRYARVEQVEVKGTEGITRKAVKLRRLPAVEGDPVTVQGHDRLDVMAQQRYAEPTWFWHIADANTELQANDLVAEATRVIRVPRS
jgi:hypothetical protein